MRFQYFDRSGNEVSLSSAESLAFRMQLEEVVDTTMLLDAETGQWARASENPTYVFLRNRLKAGDDAGAAAAAATAEFGGESAASPGEAHSPDTAESEGAELESALRDLEDALEAGREGASAPEEVDVSREPPAPEAPAEAKPPTPPESGLPVKPVRKKRAPRPTGEAGTRQSKDALDLLGRMSAADAAGGAAAPEPPPEPPPPPGSAEPVPAEEPAPEAEAAPVEEPAPATEPAPAAEAAPSVEPRPAPEAKPKKVRTGPSAGARALMAMGGAARSAGHATRAAARGTAGLWKLSAPLRAGLRRSAAAAAREGGRRVRSFARSPVALGLLLFVVAFVVFFAGDGPSRSGDVWRATVGFARSVVPGAARSADGAGADAAESPVPPPADPGDVMASEPAAGALDSAAMAARDELDRDIAMASELAAQRMMVGMDSVQRAFNLPDAPPREWLGGYYLSHASEFPAVREYWGAYRAYIRAVRAEDRRFFRRGVEEQLSASGVGATEIPPLVDRAMMGFEASQARRDTLYDTMAELAEAAVALHDLLVSREADIEYDPVLPGRVSRDPVLEAVATDPALDRQIDEHLDRIFLAMERIQGLRPVSTRVLLESLFDSLRAVAPTDAPPPGAGSGETSPPSSGTTPPPTSGSSGTIPPPASGSSGTIPPPASGSSGTIPPPA